MTTTGIHRDALVVFNIIQSLMARRVLSADDAALTMQKIADAYRRVTAGTIVEDLGEAGAEAIEGVAAKF